MQVALFLIPNLQGHLNPTSLLAKQLIKKSWHVCYVGNPEIAKFTVKHQFKLLLLLSSPFLLSNNFDNTTGFRKWLYKLNFYWKKNDEDFNRRKNDLENLISQLHPELIFLDCFYYSDFLVIQSIDPSIRCIFLDVRYPSYWHDSLIPPGNQYAFPGSSSRKLWKLYKVKRTFAELGENILYFGKSKKQLVLHKLKELKISDRYTANYKKLYYPSYQNVEEWILLPKELDFPDRKLYAWQEYIPLGFEKDRLEFIPDTLKQFLKIKETVKDSKLVFCSFGTIARTHFSLNKQKINVQSFYQKIIQIARDDATLFFAINVDKYTQEKLTDIPKSVFVSDFLPQIFILKQADLVITQSGVTMNEAASLGIPMLVIPSNEVWDFNGNAARVVYHQIGLKGSLNDSLNILKNKITSLLTEIQFSIMAKKMADNIGKALQNFNVEILLNNKP